CGRHPYSLRQWIHNEPSVRHRPNGWVRTGSGDVCIQSHTRQSFSRHRSRRFGKPQPLQREERSEEHTSELQSRFDLVCRLLLEKKKQNKESEHEYKQISCHE